MPTREPQEGPKRATASQDSSKMAPRGPQETPRDPQENPKRDPRDPKSDPTRHQERSKKTSPVKIYNLQKVLFFLMFSLQNGILECQEGTQMHSCLANLTSLKVKISCEEF